MLHLAAYDVADPRRLKTACELTRGHATGGQRSVYECFLTAAERTKLLQDMSRILDAATDRFLLIALDPRARVYTLGIGDPPSDPDYFYYV
jgi:CRISPR-associated protein Cas2